MKGIMPIFVVELAGGPRPIFASVVPFATARATSATAQGVVVMISSESLSGGRIGRVLLLVGVGNICRDSHNN